MKFSEETIKEFMSRGDFNSVMRVFRSLQREIDTKDDLLQEYMQDMSNLRSAFKELEEQRDGLKRLNTELRQLCADNGLGKKAEELQKSLGSPGVESLEELKIIEETGEPEELQPE